MPGNGKRLFRLFQIRVWITGGMAGVHTAPFRVGAAAPRTGGTHPGMAR